MSLVLPLRAARAVPLLCVLLVLTLLTALAGDASARVSWSGIHKARLGMSDSALRDRLGRPSSARGTQHAGVTVYQYRRLKLQVKMHDGRVGAVYTTSQAQKALRGVRVGMRRREMQRRLDGEDCGQVEGKPVCSLERGATVLTLEISRGRVAKIGVSR